MTQRCFLANWHGFWASSDFRNSVGGACFPHLYDVLSVGELTRIFVLLNSKHICICIICGMFLNEMNPFNEVTLRHKNSFYCSYFAG